MKFTGTIPGVVKVLPASPQVLPTERTPQSLSTHTDKPLTLKRNREDELEAQLKAERKISRALMIQNAELRDQFRVFMESKK